MFLPPPLFCPTNVSKKCPLQAKKFWGPFFQKLTFLGKFNSFLAVFSASTTEKALRRQKIWEPLFCAPEAREIFLTNFSFSSDQIFILVWYPLKKFGDNVCIMYMVHIIVLTRRIKKFSMRSISWSLCLP